MRSPPNPEVGPIVKNYVRLKPSIGQKLKFTTYIAVVTLPISGVTGPNVTKIVHNVEKFSLFEF